MNNPEMLVLLEKQLDNYPAIMEFVKGRDIISSTLMTPQGVATLAAEAHSNDRLVKESFAFLDSVALLSTFFSDNQSSICFIDQMLIKSAQFRTPPNPRMVVGSDSLNDHLVGNSKEWLELIHCNPPLQAIFVVSTLMKLFFR